MLVNEVAAIDVDGQLLRTAQSNAAAGIKAAHLAGGCACCSVSGELQAALHELASSSSYQQLDYLVSEAPGQSACATVACDVDVMLKWSKAAGRRRDNVQSSYSTRTGLSRPCACPADELMWLSMCQLPRLLVVGFAVCCCHTAA